MMSKTPYITWLPPRCVGCQKWGHTDKNCSKNKEIKDAGDVERSLTSRETTEKSVDHEETPGVDGELSKSIDIEEPVMEGTKFNSNETTPQESFTKETLVGTDVDNQPGPVVADNRSGPDNQSSSDNQSGPVIAAAEVVSGQVSSEKIVEQVDK
ncbi:hypothetical protein DY000_02040248 [Brassica cretica]|uniref:CCHC-type domain-containing protein n=1 Tax=Brassica cretica TaxID=69181 RepID=A0ABQ7BAD7_BRACR|nr:hypothetical protein DY000_02040248 [Brassica cretica]